MPGGDAAPGVPGGEEGCQGPHPRRLPPPGTVVTCPCPRLLPLFPPRGFWGAPGLLRGMEGSGGGVDSGPSVACKVYPRISPAKLISGKPLCGGIRNQGFKKNLKKTTPKAPPAPPQCAEPPSLQLSAGPLQGPSALQEEWDPSSTSSRHLLNGEH